MEEISSTEPLEWTEWVFLYLIDMVQTVPTGESGDQRVLIRNQFNKEGSTVEFKISFPFGWPSKGL